MNVVEIVRGTNGQIKSLKLDGTPVKAKVCVVDDGLEKPSQVTLILDAVVVGHTE